MVREKQKPRKTNEKKDDSPRSRLQRILDKAKIGKEDRGATGRVKKIEPLHTREGILDRAGYEDILKKFQVTQELTGSVELTGNNSKDGHWDTTFMDIKKGSQRTESYYTSEREVELIGNNSIIAKTYRDRRIFFDSKASEFTEYKDVSVFNGNRSEWTLKTDLIPEEYRLNLFRDDIKKAAKTDPAIAAFVKNNPGLGVSLED